MRVVRISLSCLLISWNDDSEHVEEHLTFSSDLDVLVPAHLPRVSKRLHLRGPSVQLYYKSRQILHNAEGPGALFSAGFSKMTQCHRPCPKAGEQG